MHIHHSHLTQCLFHSNLKINEKQMSKIIISITPNYTNVYMNNFEKIEMPTYNESIQNSVSESWNGTPTYFSHVLQ